MSGATESSATSETNEANETTRARPPATKPEKLEKPCTSSGQRIPPKQMARELAKYLRGQHPDYDYLRQVFRHLRAEMEIEIPRTTKRLPYVPSED